MRDLKDPTCPGGAGGPDIRAVERRLVHRRSVAEVFVTDVEVVTGVDVDGHQAQVVVRAQWPRANRFHLSADGRCYDELLVAETFRQAVICSAHLVDGVPPDRHFVMNRLVLELGCVAPQVSGAPGNVVIRLRRQERHRSARDPAGGRPRRQEVHAQISCDGGSVAVGRGEVTVLDAAYYRSLRPDRRPDNATVPLPGPGLPAGRVGRHFAEDVLLAENPRRPGELLLRVDPRHPVHFDHPQDHVPGMALIDAARQAALLDRPGGRLTRLDVEFCRFIELDRPCTVVTTQTGPAQDVLETGFVQEGAVRTLARMTVSKP